MQAKKRRWIISGCTAIMVALSLCIPVMAGGYSACSELKVNIIGISSWSNDTALLDERFLDTLPDVLFKEGLSTPSNASKSNAVKGSDFSGKSDACLMDKDKKEFSIVPATPSNGERKADEKAQEKEHIEEVKQKKASDSNAGLPE